MIGGKELAWIRVFHLGASSLFRTIHPQHLKILDFTVFFDALNIAYRSLVIHQGEKACGGYCLPNHVSAVSFRILQVSLETPNDVTSSDVCREIYMRKRLPCILVFDIARES